MFLSAHVAGGEGLHRVGLDLVVTPKGFVQTDKLHGLGLCHGSELPRSRAARYLKSPLA